MKYILITFFTFIFCTNGYSQHSKDEIEKLIQLAEIYSNDNNGFKNDFVSSIEKLRTKKLNHIIDALIYTTKGDLKILSPEFLTKPDSTELKFWYVIREIHYNNKSENKKYTSQEIANKVLNEPIDEKWLLDNYYYRLHGGFAKIFNDKDLSNLNFNLDEYGLKNDVEKSILYFNLSNSFIQRFKVLNAMKNHDKLLEFESRLPTFNNKQYFELNSFDFEDFDWIGYEKTESYKKRHIKNLFESLLSNMVALGEKNRNDDAINLYFKSILTKPEYFKYSENLEPDLQSLYQQFNKK
ncbi:hypothetical protein [Chryseobacterium koreense]|uniref:hypothetical protein n=1 Tax=Chryseobacterium koreense TaxID=232216 RepID=UPI0026EFCB18|nr:hypothetical protein [Chryseobacterium koreense]